MIITHHKRLTRILGLATIVGGFLGLVTMITWAAMQNTYRWRNDNGTEATATNAAAANTALPSLAKNTGARVRFGAANSGAESELLRKAAGALQTGERYLHGGVVDAVNGYAYFGTATVPARIVKVALGAGSDPPTVVGTLTLNTGEDQIRTAVIDTTNGYAYFGTYTTPAKVIKVALGAGAAAPTRIGAVTLNSGENYIFTAGIDADNGYAYFGTYTTPAGIVVKVALGAGAAAPTRIDAVTLNAGEPYLYSAVIDTTNGYAYFGNYTYVCCGNGSVVVKVALGAGAAAPTRIGAVTLNAGEVGLASAAIDVDNGYAYFGTWNNPTPGIVVKIALGAGSDPPTRVGAIGLNAGELALFSAVIDTTHGYAYFGTATSPGIVVKIALGAGSDPPTRIGAVTLDSGENILTEAVIDVDGGYAYFGTNTSPGNAVKIALGAGSDPPTRVNAVTMERAEENISVAVIDTVNGYAYFGTDTSPATVIKVALGTGSNPPTRIGAVTLNTGEDYFDTAVIDATNGYAYFGTYTSATGIVVKIALGAGSDPPTRVGATSLNSGEHYLYSAVIDTTNGYAYFGTDTSPGIVVKVALGAGAANPSRVGALSLVGANEDYLDSATIDTTHGYAYFGTYTSPGNVVKVALGAGSDPPTRVGAAPLNSGEDILLFSAVIDTVNGYAYFGTKTSPGIVVKIALNGDSAPTRVGATTDATPLSAGENELESAVIDTVNGYAYFGTNTSPGIVVKVALGAGAAAPSRVGALSLVGANEDYLDAATIDIANGYAYFGTYTAPGNIVKVSLAPKPKFRLEYGTKVTSCAAIASWTQVPTTATTEHFQMFNSTNLTDGAATTDYADLANGNTNFLPGQVKDTSSQTSEISLGETQFTEIEYSIEAMTDAVDGGNYCLRMTDTGTGLASYTNYAELAIAAGISDADSVAAAKTALNGSTLSPADGTNTSVITTAGMAQAIVDGVSTGVTVTISSTANPHVGAGGAITYDATAETSNVVFTLTKNAANDTATASVAVPKSNAAKVAAAKAILDAASLSPADGTNTSVLTMAHTLVDATSTDVIITIGSTANPHVGAGGAITYDATAQTASAVFHLVKGASNNDSTVSVAVPKSNASKVDAAKTVLASASLGPVEGTNTSVLTMAHSLVDATSTDVTVTVNTTANSHVASNGTITYDTLAETASVTFHLVKGASNDDSAAVSVAVPQARASHGGSSSPSVGLYQLTGGQNLTGGDTFQIIWWFGGTGIVSTRVSLSTDSGANYSTIATNLSGGSYLWHIPDIATTHARIKIEGLNSSSLVIASSSSASDFTISIPAVIPSSGATLPSIPPPPIHDFAPQAETEAASTIDSEKGLVAVTNPACIPGSLFRGTLSTVYYCGIDGKRYPFPNPKTYFTWFLDFSQVRRVQNAVISKLKVGGYVTYRPGVRMLKLETNAMTYGVSAFATLRFVPDETTAADLYGSAWSEIIDVVPQAFWGNYTVGASIK